MSLATWTNGTAADILDDESATDYSESKDSGQREDFSPDNGSAERIFFTAWNMRFQFIDALMGYSTQAGTGISRELPDPHPDSSVYYCSHANTIQGLGKVGIDPYGGAQFDLAKISATYMARDYAVLADQEINGSELNRFCSRKRATTSQYLSLQGYMKFVTRVTNMQPGTMQATPGKIVCAVQKTITWHQVPADPNNPFECPDSAVIDEYVGCVNSMTFDGHVAGTVLFLGYEPVMVKPRLNGTNYMWDIAYTFLVMNNGSPIAGDTVNAAAGHNYIYDTQNSRWDLLTSNGLVTGNQIYPNYDLNQLFTLTNNED